MRGAILVRRVVAPIDSPYKDALIPSDEQSAAAMAKLGLGEDVAIKVVRDRSGPHHRLFFGILEHVAESSEYETTERLLVALKIRLGYFDVCRLPNGKAVPVPQSISFAAMDQADFSRFFEAAINVICTEILGGYDGAQLIREVEEMLGLPPIEQHQPPGSTDRPADAGPLSASPDRASSTLGAPPADIYTNTASPGGRAEAGSAGSVFANGRLPPAALSEDDQL